MPDQTSSKFPKLPKYVKAYLDRRGDPRFYLRRRGCKAIALPGLPWSPEFMTAYQAALNGQAPIVIGANRTAQGSVAQLVAQYLGSIDWQELSAGTRRTRLNLLNRFRASHGTKRAGSMTTADVNRMLGELKTSVRVSWRSTLYGLYDFGITAQICETNPIEDVKVKRHASDGFHTWTETEIARFEAYWPSGTFERLAFTLMLCTGAAIADAVKLSRTNIHDGCISYIRQKTGQRIEGLPILPELQRELDQVRDRLMILVGRRGQPLKAATLGDIMPEAYKAAGVPNLPSHGLRKACARRLAEAGVGVQGIMAVLGQSDPKMALHYCKQAEKAKLARQAMAQLRVSNSN